MQLWPCDSEIHKAGSLNHFIVSATRNVVFQHNHPEKIEKKKVRHSKRSSLICLKYQLFFPHRNEAKGHRMSAMTA